MCAAYNGNLVSVNVDTHEIEEIGEFDGGIKAMSWTSDQEMALIATGVNTLITMTASWSVLSEVSFEPADEGAEMNVCWRGDGQYFAQRYDVAVLCSWLVTVHVPVCMMREAMAVSCVFGCKTVHSTH